MNSKGLTSLTLFLLAAGTAGAQDAKPAIPPTSEVKVPNIPPELSPSAVSAPAAAPIVGDTSADLADPAKDLTAQAVQREAPALSLPARTVTERHDSEPTEGKKLKSGEIAVRIGEPAQRAIAESRAWAENPNALPLRDSGGRVVFSFDESAPTIMCATMFVCDIELQPGENVQGAPHIGDSVRWKVAPAVSGSEDRKVTHLIVKPTEPGLDTNLIVPTDRRTYHLRLVSSSRVYVSSVAFSYPDEQQNEWHQFASSTAAGGSSGVSSGDLPTVAVNRLNFNYVIKVVKGKPSFKPLRAMDDGYHTYIAMNEELPQGDAPVLIGISPTKEEQMINYRLKGNIYIVDGTAPRLALVSGVGHQQQRIELTRTPCEKHGWLGICWDPKE
jgi:type IV secretion system protein VirB9